MALINEVKRGVPPMPDPRDTDQARINRQIVDVVRYLLTKFDQVDSEKRLSELEAKVSDHNDILHG